MQLEQYKSGRFSLSNTPAVTQRGKYGQFSTVHEYIRKWKSYALSQLVLVKRHIHNHRQLSDTMSNTLKG